MIASWLLHMCVMDSSRVLDGCVMDVSWVRHACFMDVFSWFSWLPVYGVLHRYETRIRSRSLTTSCVIYKIDEKGPGGS